MNDPVEPEVMAELTQTLAILASRHDVLPFMTGTHSSGEVRFRPLPDDMLALIVQ